MCGDVKLTNRRVHFKSFYLKSVSELPAHNLVLTLPANFNKLARGCEPEEKILNMTHFHMFVIRAILGVVFAVILTRFFYPHAKLIYIIGLAVILLGLAYFSEYLRQRKKTK